jgi:hypothetical protein
MSGHAIYLGHLTGPNSFYGYKKGRHVVKFNDGCVYSF